MRPRPKRERLIGSDTDTGTVLWTKVLVSELTRALPLLLCVVEILTVLNLSGSLNVKVLVCGPVSGPVLLVPELLPIIVAEVVAAGPDPMARVYASILVPAATAAGSTVTVKPYVRMSDPKPAPPEFAVERANVVSEPDSLKATKLLVTAVVVKSLKVLSPIVQVKPGMKMLLITVGVVGQSTAYA